MPVLIMLIVVLIVAALLIWAVRAAPLPQPFSWILQALIAVVAALVILGRAGIV